MTISISAYRLNPRWVCWLVSRGEDPGTFVAKYVEDGEDTIPAVLAFSLWIRARWSEWATELGFKRGNYWEAHDAAHLAGHPPEEFDAWLRAKVGVEQ